MNIRVFVGILLLFLGGRVVGQDLAAFPGAEGGGSLSVGGRGGVVCQVTNLNDSGPGSLRQCVDMSGPRTVVFRVGGTIKLKSTLMIKNPFITIAGQTAPGQGIQLSGKEHCDYSTLRITTHHVIVRYLSVRKGVCDPRKPGVPIGVAINNTTGKGTYNQPNNIIIDHLSGFWAHDEEMTVWGQTTKNIDRSQAPHKITFQYNIMAEVLRDHSTAFITGSNDWLIAEAMLDIDLNKNLFAHNSHRNPLLKNGRSRIINNIIYNWGYYATQLGPGISADVINNLYKHPRPTATNLARRSEIQVFMYNDLICNHSGYIHRDPSIYVEGNQGPYNSNSNDKWDMVKHVHCENGVILENFPIKYRRSLPLAPVGVPISALPVAELESQLLPTIGNSQQIDCTGNWVFKRDSQDARIVSEVQTNYDPSFNSSSIFNYNRFGIYEEDDVGGFPFISSGTACEDTDNDGMPDEWELAKNLDPKKPSDRNQLHPSGYTMLEMYLNGPVTGF